MADWGFEPQLSDSAAVFHTTGLLVHLSKPLTPCSRAHPLWPPREPTCDTPSVNREGVEGGGHRGDFHVSRLLRRGEGSQVSGVTHWEDAGRWGRFSGAEHQLPQQNLQEGYFGPTEAEKDKAPSGNVETVQVLGDPTSERLSQELGGPAGVQQPRGRDAGQSSSPKHPTVTPSRAGLLFFSGLGGGRDVWTVPLEPACTTSLPRSPAGIASHSGLLSPFKSRSACAMTGTPNNSRALA